MSRACRRVSPAGGGVTTATSLPCEKRLDDSEEQLGRVLLRIMTGLRNGDHLSERQRLQLHLLLGCNEAAAAADHVERRRLDLLHVVPELEGAEPFHHFGVVLPHDAAVRQPLALITNLVAM